AEGEKSDRADRLGPEVFPGDVAAPKPAFLLPLPLRLPATNDTDRLPSFSSFSGLRVLVARKRNRSRLHFHQSYGGTVKTRPPLAQQFRPGIVPSCSSAGILS